MSEVGFLLMKKARTHPNQPLMEGLVLILGKNVLIETDWIGTATMIKLILHDIVDKTKLSLSLFQIGQNDSKIRLLSHKVVGPIDRVNDPNRPLVQGLEIDTFFSVDDVIRIARKNFCVISAWTWRSR